MTQRKKHENPFEEGMQNLGRIAEQLESGALGLDDSLAAFEEGIRLYRRLQEQLAAAELKIETIMAENRPAVTPEEEDGV